MSKSDEKSRIILLHGMGGTGSLWRPIAAALENEFSIMAPDQRGHGQSQDTDEKKEKKYFSPESFARDLIETQSASGFYPAFVLGHSMGMRTAAALAHLKPEWVQGLILVDLGFSGPAGGGLGSLLYDFLKQLPLDFADRPAAKIYMEANCPDASMAQYLLAVSVVQDGRLKFPFDRDALLLTLEAARDTDARKWIWEAAERGMPILNLRGAESGVYDADEFRREQQAFSVFPQVRFVEIAGAGHGLPFERRIEFIECVRRFIRAQLSEAVD